MNHAVDPQEIAKMHMDMVIAKELNEYVEEPEVPLDGLDAEPNHGKDRSSSDSSNESPPTNHTAAKKAAKKRSRASTPLDEQAIRGLNKRQNSRQSDHQNDQDQPLVEPDAPQSPPAADAAPGMAQAPGSALIAPVPELKLQLTCRFCVNDRPVEYQCTSGHSLCESCFNKPNCPAQGCGLPKPAHPIVSGLKYLLMTTKCKFECIHRCGEEYELDALKEHELKCGVPCPVRILQLKLWPSMPAGAGPIACTAPIPHRNLRQHLLEHGTHSGPAVNLVGGSYSFGIDLLDLDLKVAVLDPKWYCLYGRIREFFVVKCYPLDCKNDATLGGMLQVVATEPIERGDHVGWSYCGFATEKSPLNISIHEDCLNLLNEVTITVKKWNRRDVRSQ